MFFKKAVHYIHVGPCTIFSLFSNACMTLHTFVRQSPYLSAFLIVAGWLTYNL